MITRAYTILMVRITAFRIGPSFDNDGTGRGGHVGGMMRFNRMFYMIFIIIVGFVLLQCVIEVELFVTVAENATFTF